MIVYHGTTRRRAQRICINGFLPRKPSRRVWFAEARSYARGRAKTQARRAHDQAVVLTCEIDVAQMRKRYGPHRVMHRNRVIGISAPVPVTVLRSHPAVELSYTPEGLAAWINRLLGVKRYKGVGRSHPGIQRLCRWVERRLSHQPKVQIKPSELLHLATQWMPEYFEGVVLDPQRLKVVHGVKTVEVAVEASPADVRQDEALRLLDDPSPKRRIRGLGMLAEMKDPDLFDWCVMHLDDESVNVRLAALHTILQCEDGEPEVLEPLARSEDKRIRGAAIAALARHGGDEALEWFQRGLKDPDACVRRQVVALLAELDPARHRAIFELALYDPNPDVEYRALKAAQGKGYARPKW
jgi:hypothetical protein